MEQLLHKFLNMVSTYIYYSTYVKTSNRMSINQLRYNMNLKDVNEEEETLFTYNK